MYTEFYRLSARPFQLTPDARFFFESTVHRQAMAYMVYGLHHAEGFIIITGEVGAGKTILVDNLLSTIDQSTFVTAKIVTTQLAGDDLLHLVAGGFGIANEGLAKGSLLQRISDFALAQHRNNKRVLLIVDEAQNLSFEALEELRQHPPLTGIRRHEIEDQAVFLLAVAMDTTHALFKPHRVPRDVVVHHQPAELQVDTLARRFGRHEDLAGFAELAFCVNPSAGRIPVAYLHAPVYLSHR